MNKKIRVLMAAIIGVSLSIRIWNTAAVAVESGDDNIIQSSLSS